MRNQRAEDVAVFLCLIALVVGLLIARSCLGMGPQDGRPTAPPESFYQ